MATLNISIGATLEPLKKSISGVMSMMSTFASNLGSQGAELKNQIDAASKDIQKELDQAVKGFSNFNNEGARTKGTTDSLKSMRAQLREATNDAYRMAQRFGMNSEEAVNAQKKVADLKETMSDMDARVKAMNPEGKLQALGDAAKGAVGIVQGLSGAMAMFGAESEQSQQVIAKLQSLMAMSQGITSIMGMADSFSTLKVVIGQNIAALTTLKGALMATGIGALAVGLGLLIANFDTVTNSIYKFFTGEDTAATKTEKLKAATEEYKKQLDALGKQLDVTNRVQQLSNSTILDEKKKFYADLERQRKYDTEQELLKAKKGEQSYEDALALMKAINAKYNIDKQKQEETFAKQEEDKLREGVEKYKQIQLEKLQIQDKLKALFIASLTNETEQRIAQISESAKKEKREITELYNSRKITAQEYATAISNIETSASNQIVEAKIKANQDILTDTANRYAEEKKLAEESALLYKQKIEVQKQLDDSIIQMKIDNSEEIEAIDKKTGENYVKTLEDSKKITMDFGAEVKNLAVDSFVALGEAIGEVASGQNGLAGFFTKMGSIISSFLIQIGKSLITTAIASKAFKVAFANPAVALAAGVAAIAAGTILKNQLQKGPAFANGGIVYGPTVGLMGEYAGAKSNPEVIAPLDKLKSMMGGQMMNVQGLLYGNDLAIVSSRTQSFTNRRR